MSGKLSSQAFRMVGKVSTFVVALVVLTILNVLQKQLTGWDADFLVGWVSCGLYGFLCREGTNP